MTVSQKTALIMSGGGAHAAYQVGVLRALARLTPPEVTDPFQIYCGTSAGAINCAALAAHTGDFRLGVHRLAHIWGHFHVDQVFAADWLSLLATGARWFAAMGLGGIGRYQPLALLDRSPLEQLLRDHLSLENIAGKIQVGALHAVSVTASSYSSGQSVTFFQGSSRLREWQRADRCGVATTLTVDHLLASSAIPFIFAPVRVDNDYFGDGSMRQTAPLSAALHLGAEKLFVVGVQSPVAFPPAVSVAPSFARIAGHALNSIFLEGLDADLERLERINQAVRAFGNHVEPPFDLREVECFALHPSIDLAASAALYQWALPRALGFLLRGLGGRHRQGAALLSYLLFERPYCRHLMAVGYADAMAQKLSILRFFGYARGAEESTVSTAPSISVSMPSL